MEKRKKILFAVICIFVVMAMSTVLFVLWGRKNILNSERKIEDDFTKMEIKLQNVDLKTVESNKNVKYTGNEVAILNDNEKKEFNGVEIKGHGNSTWQNAKKWLY